MLTDVTNIQDQDYNYNPNTLNSGKRFLKSWLSSLNRE